MKKRGFGMGKYNGVGGKLEKGETVLDAAKRETFEEIGVNPTHLIEIAINDYYFPAKLEWNVRVIIFLCDKWEGKISESEEMKPYWFGFDDIPFDKLWDGDKYWLKQILSGIKIKGEFLMTEDNSKVAEISIKEIPS